MNHHSRCAALSDGECDCQPTPDSLRVLPRCERHYIDGKEDICKPCNCHIPLFPLAPDTQFCAISLCEWEAVTTRGDRHLCAQCAEAFDAGALEDSNELEARRADALQLERMARMINEATPGFRSMMGSECDHAEVALAVLIKERNRNASFAGQFLATFYPYVDNDEEIPGTFAVDRVTEFVRALVAKEVA